ncbi:ABC transporter permease [Roseisalinus antarcticus]|uniref:ABC transporter permease n=1 Tax=Roseisalinus antarcticus TaxID=254357 RepID=UPI001F470259|nr:iron ABC transporter permease [Roseisalinus antarcticus]
MILIVTLLSGLPLALLFRTGLTDATGLTVVPLLEALQSPSLQRALWNSVQSAGLSAFCATSLGTALALVIGLTDVRARGLLVFLILLPMMIPPHVTAIAWLQALGPGSPLLGALGLAPPAGSPHPMHGLGGLVTLLTIQHAPLVFLILRATLRSFPRELVEAARLSGAGMGRILRRIILPLLAPALLAGFMLAFTAALGNFGINALIGVPGRFTTLPVLIWQRLAAFGPGMLPGVAVIALILALLTIVVLGLQLLLTRRLRTQMGGLAQAPLAHALGPLRPAVEAGLWLVVGATLVLPLSALVATSLVPTYGVPLSSVTATLANYAEVLLRQEVTARAFVNSTVIAGTAALLIAMLAILMGHFMTRGSRSGQRAAGLAVGQAEVAYAVPGLVVSVAFILAFIQPVMGLRLYNTIWIILLAYVAAFLAIGLKPVLAAFAQMDSSLDDAGRVSGAGFGRRIRRISAPLAAPAAASGAILVFLTAYNEVTVSSLLWSTGNETIGTVIFNYESGGYTTLAAAMSVVTVLATVVLMLCANLMGRRLPPGIVPWRE